MTLLNRVTREFFTRDTTTVAKDLIGRYLIRKTKFGDAIGKIILEQERG